MVNLLMCFRNFQRRLQAIALAITPPLLLLVDQTNCFGSLSFAVALLVPARSLPIVLHLTVPIVLAQHQLFHFLLLLAQPIHLLRWLLLDIPAQLLEHCLLLRSQLGFLRFPLLLILHCFLLTGLLVSHLQPQLLSQALPLSQLPILTLLLILPLLIDCCFKW